MKQMAQRTGGIWKIFSSPLIYQGIQNLLGKRTRGLFFDQYIKAKPGDFILDVGCGTGEIVEYLHADIRYVGIDLSAEYIRYAMRRKHNNVDFICGDVTDFDYVKFGRPDIILAEGLIHHLTDEEAGSLFAKLARLIDATGRIITIDPCVIERQHIVARSLILLDRGKNVRMRDGYCALASRYFNSVISDIRNDLLVTPYTHCIMECSNRHR